MAGLRSRTIFFSCLSLRIKLGLTATTTPEQLFWTQGLPQQEPPADLTATILLPSQTTTTFTSTDPSVTPTPNPDNNTICTATSITCPICNNARILDSQNHTYHILCANKLYSDSPFPLQRQPSLSACLEACHKYPWCRGVTSGPEGNCQLARGENVFPQGADEEYVAMLRIPDGFVPEPPATVPSAFPTGSIPLAPPPVQSDRPATCDLSHIACPYSRGKTIRDGHNANYTVRCNFQPLCRSFTVVEGRQSKCSCLAQCDRDSGCLAALFNRGRCDLCQESLEGLSTYRSLRDYIVFVSEVSQAEAGLTSEEVATSSSPPRLTPMSLSYSNLSTSSSRTTRTASTSRRAASSTSTRRMSSTTPRSSTSNHPASRSIPRLTTSSPPIQGRPSSTSTPPPPAFSTRAILQFPVPFAPITPSSPTPPHPPISSSSPPSLLISSSTQNTRTTPNTPSPAPTTSPLPSADPGIPARLPPLSSVACPAWDNANVFAADTSRNYIIQCDAAFGAAITKTTDAVDFVACARECRGECGGWVLNNQSSNSSDDMEKESEDADDGDGDGDSANGRGNDGSGPIKVKNGYCTVYTSLSLIYSQPGATAGVWNGSQHRNVCEMDDQLARDCSSGGGGSGIDYDSSGGEVVRMGKGKEDGGFNDRDGDEPGQKREGAGSWEK